MGKTANVKAPAPIVDPVLVSDPAWNALGREVVGGLDAVREIQKNHGGVKLSSVAAHVERAFTALSNAVAIMGCVDDGDPVPADLLAAPEDNPQEEE